MTTGPEAEDRQSKIIFRGRQVEFVCPQQFCRNMRGREVRVCFASEIKQPVIFNWYSELEYVYENEKKRLEECRIYIRGLLRCVRRLYFNHDTYDPRTEIALRQTLILPFDLSRAGYAKFLQGHIGPEATAQQCART